MPEDIKKFNWCVTNTNDEIIALFPSEEEADAYREYMEEREDTYFFSHECQQSIGVNVSIGA